MAGRASAKRDGVLTLQKGASHENLSPKVSNTPYHRLYVTPAMPLIEERPDK